jgi:sugar phosphate isomerase/epimerase
VNTNKIGVMQGRLSKATGDRIQSFPNETWKNEFNLASKLGLKKIEWVIDFDVYHTNPLLIKSDLPKIKQLIKNEGVTIPSICVDYFATHPPILSAQIGDIEKLIHSLIQPCIDIGIKIVEIPLIGEASINKVFDKPSYIKTLKKLFSTLTCKGIKVALETDLEPIDVRRMIDKFSSDYIGVNYDIGNSAFWGFDMEKELSLFGDAIFNIHLKDCTPNDYSVKFGTGNSKFYEMFMYLNELCYDGDLILQGVRYGDDFECVRSQIEYVEQELNKCN